MTSKTARGTEALVLCLGLALTAGIASARGTPVPRFPAPDYETSSDAPAPGGIGHEALTAARPELRWSGCLSLAAEMVLATAAEDGDPHLPDGRLLAITRAAGCPDPLPSVLVVDTSEPGSTDVVAELRRAGRDADGPATHVGIARGAIDRGRFRWRWVVILSSRPAELISAVPRVLDPGVVIPLHVRLARGLDAPTAVVAPPDGGLRRQVLTPDDRGAWWTLIPAGTAEGALTVQLFAESGTGPRLTAVFDLWVGADAPDPVFDDDASATGRRTFDTVEDARRWMLTRLNELRREAGVRELNSDADLDRVATDHCEDMRRGNFVGHRSPATGDLPDRLRAAGVDYRSARENVAWAGGVESAMRQLEHSPAHRANLLAADVDHVGLGFAETLDGDSARRLLVTQVFIAAPPSVTLDEVLAAASRGVDDLRRRTGRHPAIRCPELDAAAAALAADPDAMALDVHTSFVRIRDALGPASERWGSLKMSVVRVGEPAEVVLPDILQWDDAGAWGVAVHRLRSDQLPRFQVVWVVANDVPWRACD